MFYPVVNDSQNGLDFVLKNIAFNVTSETNPTVKY